MSKPRITFLADRPGWAFDINAHGASEQLQDKFDFRIEYVVQQPNLLSFNPDLLVVMFWGEQYHHRFGFPQHKVLKQISSHRWNNEKQYGEMNAEQMATHYLGDCSSCIVPSKRLLDIFSPLVPVTLTSKGIDPSIFSPRPNVQGELTIGWVGNAKDSCKGLHDILVPATRGRFKFLIADGSLNQSQLVEFYNSIDVIAVASTAEGDPRPLIEAMACGCFAVAVNVGIVPEMVNHGDNGFIVERTIESFQIGFEAVAEHIDFIRQERLRRAEPILAKRSWQAVAPGWERALRYGLQGS